MQNISIISPTANCKNILKINKMYTALQKLLNVWNLSWKWLFKYRNMIFFFISYTHNHLLRIKFKKIVAIRTLNIIPFFTPKTYSVLTFFLIYQIWMFFYTQKDHTQLIFFFSFSIHTKLHYFQNIVIV